MATETPATPPTVRGLATSLFDSSPSAVKWAVEKVSPAARKIYEHELVHNLVEKSENAIDSQLQKHPEIVEKAVTTTKGVIHSPLVASITAKASSVSNVVTNTLGGLTASASATTTTASSEHEQASNDDDATATSSTTTKTSPIKRLRHKASELSSYWSKVSAENAPSGISGIAAVAVLKTLSAADQASDYLVSYISAGETVDASASSSAAGGEGAATTTDTAGNVPPAPTSTNATIGELSHRLRHRAVAAAVVADQRSRLSALSIMQFATKLVVNSFHLVDNFPVLAASRDTVMNLASPLVSPPISWWNRALKTMERNAHKKQGKRGDDKNNNNNNNDNSNSGSDDDTTGSRKTLDSEFAQVDGRSDGSDAADNAANGSGGGSRTHHRKKRNH